MIKDITGQRSGKLVAIRPTEKRTSNGQVIWECQCDCGNISYVKSSAIIRQDIKSCGCVRTQKLIAQNKNNIIDLTGKRFGRLVVLEQAPKPGYYKKNSAFWKCQCDCGNICIVDGNNLRRNNTQSCGCMNSENSSHGQEKIKNILLAHNIRFQTEKIFKDCKFPDTGYYARFDFYLPDYNILIEYDGSQHFCVGRGKYDNKKQVERIQKHDLLKNDFAERNGIKLIRIPYYEYDNINLKMLLGQVE